MEDITLQKYNFRKFMGATNILLNTSITPPSDYLAELSTVSSDNIYLINTKFNYYLVPEDSFGYIYMNDNICGMARELTALHHTDFLQTSNFNYVYVNNMHTTYANCFKLRGSPVSGKHVKTMYGTYFNDKNLTGNFKIGKEVNNLIATYYNCFQLENLEIQNTNATMMISTFYNCTNLAGSPIDADYAKSLKDCYYNCYLIDGAPANCNAAFITTNTYYNCPNLYGTFYWLYNKASQAAVMNTTNMFYGRNYSNSLNIYVYNQSATLNALVNYSSTYGNIYGTSLTWTKTTYGQGLNCYNNALTNTNIIVLEDLSKEICFGYTHNIQTFTVPETGYYRLEAWGAQGESVVDGTTEARGGYGAYAYGEILLNQGDILYIGVGGQDGYNGGGEAKSWDGSELPIVWSGNYNKLTVEVDENKIIFRIYTNDTLIYSYEAYIGTQIIDLKYINVSFLKHDGLLQAKPSFIYYDGSTTYTYNAEEPTDSEMADIYTWLSAGLS